MVNADGACGTQTQAKFLVRYERHQGIVWTKEVDTLDGAHTELRAFRHAAGTRVPGGGFMMGMHCPHNAGLRRNDITGKISTGCSYSGVGA